MMRRHESAHDRQIGHEIGGAHQVFFALALHILESGNRVVYVLNDLRANMCANYTSDNYKASPRQENGDEEQRKQEFGAKRHGIDYGTKRYPTPCTVRKCAGFAGSCSSFWRSLRM